jgi:DNA-binding MarR family transcriptional regulator
MNPERVAELNVERAALVERAQELQRDVRRALRPMREWLTVDLTVPQIKVLFALHVQDEATMSVLARTLGVTTSTMTAIVDRLVERRLVGRGGQAGDRRRIVCQLTPQGAELVERLQQGGRDRMLRLLGMLTVPELRQVVAGFAALHAASERCPAAPGEAALPAARPVRESGEGTPREVACAR